MFRTIAGKETDSAATRAAIDSLLTSPQLSTAEKGCLANALSDHVRAGRYVSGFTTSLFASMHLAIDSDLDRLGVAYPEEVAAYRSWQSGLLAAKARPLLGASRDLLN